jgi:hypothetical protein
LEIRLEMFYDGTKNGLRCSPYPIDIIYGSPTGA